MVESRQTLGGQDENADRMTTDQSSIYSTDTNLDEVSRSRYPDSMTTGQPYTGSTGTSMNAEVSPSYTGSTGTSMNAGVSSSAKASTTKPQGDTSTPNKDDKSGLNRALVGGLIGLTLGSLAGALAGKRIGQGFNRTVKGVGEATKTIGDGIGLTAKGLGDAAKSVAEGAIEVVVGGAMDTAGGIVEGAKQTTLGTIDALQNTAQGVNQAVQSVADKAKDTAQDVTQSVQSAADKAKDTAQNARPFENQGTSVRNLQTTNDEIITGYADRTPTVYVSDSDQIEGSFGDLPMGMDE